MSREIDLRITAPPEQGFCVWESGEMLAAFTSRYELAQWLERRLGVLPGEQEREAADMADMQRSLGNVEAFPSVVRPRTEPKRTRWGIKQ
jgi:hypothetical protein